MSDESVCKDEVERGLDFEYHCRNCDWYGGRGDLDTDQCPECGSFDVTTNRY